MKKVVVLGYGKSGKSAGSFLKKRGYEVFFVNEKKEIDFSDIDLFILSSGILDTHPLAVKAKKKGVLVMGEADLGFSFFSNKCIGVTGTNGKTTVVLLMEHILKKTKKVKAIGNIGVSITSIEPKEEILIAELSSFQLQKMKKKCLDVGIILNITEDHTEKHGSFLKYVKAKCRIQYCLKKNKKLIVFEDVIKKYGKLFQKNISIEVFKEEKTGVYLALKDFGVSYEDVLLGYEEFKKLPHRMEWVSSIKDIHFYNDSKSTNPASTIYAIDHLNSDILLIAGGEDKGVSFKLWKKKMKNNVKYIFLIGKCANKIEKELSCRTMLCKNLKQAVWNAYKMAKKGDAILLSPGCASFDQFKNYEHRGEVFKCLVQYLKNKEEA